MSDRTVHARLANGVEIVRYDRAGKWYAEGGPLTKRAPLTVRHAAHFARRPGAVVFFGRRGGAAFDRRVRALGGAE